MSATSGFGRTKAANRSKLVGSKVAYKGKRFNVLADTLIEPGGFKHVKEVVRRNGSIVVLAVDASQDAGDPDVILERQWRHATGSFLVELPAGGIEDGEKPLAAAKREMVEETGFRAKRWSLLTKYFASPGFVGEVMHIFLAEGLSEGEAKPEPDEAIEVARVRLSEALRMVRDGEIVDGKTMIGLLMYEARLRGGNGLQ